ncbi:m41.1 protein [Murid betaherpesvirus 1]|uniref:M41.1 n=2 Tax=Murid herpesvirus 1 TaxID=10366 RepID=A0A7D5JKZ9_MUHV1|nr:mitochondrion-localized antiapoptotic protein m41.1 [Murid betaherpesvirus 1]QLF98950.1 m41.1 [Muromegalovirus G4]QNL29190.1 m41.1 [Muromegalovirus G4]WEG71703.1 protein m41.1 [Murid betaherpesvirus 1]CCE56551.1 m41.1 protein [Murid betaherpesvirus 1]
MIVAAMTAAYMALALPTVRRLPLPRTFRRALREDLISVALAASLLCLTVSSGALRRR